MVGYDLKNDIEKLTSNNIDELHFPDLFFFQPKKIFYIKGTTVTVKYISQFKNEIDFDMENMPEYLKYYYFDDLTIEKQDEVNSIDMR